MSEKRQTALMESLYGISRRQRATGSSALAVTLAPAQRWILKEVRLHLNAAGGSGDFTVTLDSGTNAVYDVQFLKQDMSTTLDVVWQPDKALEFEATDELDFAWANAGGKTYGLEILYTLI